MLLATSRSGCYDEVVNEQGPAPGLGSAIETAIDAGYAARDAARAVSTPSPKTRWVDLLGVFAAQNRTGAQAAARATMEQSNDAVAKAGRFDLAARAVLERVTDRGLEETLVDAGAWSDRVRLDVEEADAVRVAMGQTLDELNRLRVNLRLGRPLDRPIH